MDIQKYIQINPGDVRGILLYGNLLYSNSNLIDALFQYNRAIWLDERNFDAQFGIGMCLINLGKFNNAIMALRQALKIDPYNHITYYYLGLSLIAIGNDKDAISSFTQSLLLDPDNVDTYFNLGKSYYETGKIIQAREAFNRVINIDIQYEVEFNHENSIKVRVQHGAMEHGNFREGFRVYALFNPQKVILFDEDQKS